MMLKFWPTCCGERMILELEDNNPQPDKDVFTCIKCENVMVIDK